MPDTIRPERTLAVVSAGLSQPSSTRLLADKLTAASVARLTDEGFTTRVVTYELRDYAQDIMNNMLTRFASLRLETMIEAVTAADGLIAVTPIFTTSYSGLFKTFFDVIDNRSLTDQPVVIGATAGTARHSLALDYALRPMFTYLHAVVVPTSVFAASEDWGSGDGGIDSRLATLPARIERAAGELAALVAASDRSTRVRDPFELPAGFNPAGFTRVGQPPSRQ
ncbi:FMN reductase [Cryobacterium aureum]|uniref:FMN reductase n=1 Tax=Cryobacterium aureum TaxID=995037 RepID=UPI001F0CD80D|nr:FMN reductase [Cryobacterium aureum]